MKKVVLFLVIAIMAITSGCTNNKIEYDLSNTYIENQDYQYNFFNKNTGNTIIQKGNDGYYFSLNNFLYFADKKTLKSVPLCNKSDCLHDKEPNPEKRLDCNAYLFDSPLNSSFYVFKNHIYKFVDESYYDGKDLIIVNTIYQSDLNGTNSKKLFSINQTIIRWFIHRGTLYYTTAVDNKLFGYDLDIRKKNMIVDLDSIGLYNLYVENITAYGNNIYFIVNGYENEESYNKTVNGEEITTIEEVYVINTVDNTDYTITSENGNSGIIFEGFFDDCFIISDADYNAENTEKKMYSIDNGGNKKLLDFTYENLFDFHYFDNNFTYIKKGTNIDDVEKNIFEVYSDDKLLTTIDFPDGYANDLYLGDEDYLFYYEDNENVHKLYCISKSDLYSGCSKLTLSLNLIINTQALCTY